MTNEPVMDIPQFIAGFGDDPHRVEALRLTIARWEELSKEELGFVALRCLRIFDTDFHRLEAVRMFLWSHVVINEEYVVPLFVDADYKSEVLRILRTAKLNASLVTSS
jgi:hypothetical protein